VGGDQPWNSGALRHGEGCRGTEDPRVKRGRDLTLDDVERVPAAAIIEVVGATAEPSASGEVRMARGCRPEHIQRIDDFDARPVLRERFSPSPVDLLPPPSSPLFT
jgi:hypothetical protein